MNTAIQHENVSGSHWLTYFICLFWSYDIVGAKVQLGSQVFIKPLIPVIKRAAIVCRHIVIVMAEVAQSLLAFL